MADPAFFCPLSHEGILAVRGPDANKFLQGQVTCNLNYLHDKHCSLGARCTPKGRMQSSFRIVQVSDGFATALIHGSSIAMPLTCARSPISGNNRTAAAAITP
jgi:folate-binding Fe-S cluster repair protein YgfZ